MNTNDIDRLNRWTNGLAGDNWKNAKALWDEIQELTLGLQESIQSEDYNRYLRWQAEEQEAIAKKSAKEANEWMQAVAWTLFTHKGPLDVLRLERKLELQEQVIERLEAYLQEKIEQLVALQEEHDQQHDQ